VEEYSWSVSESIGVTMTKTDGVRKNQEPTSYNASQFNWPQLILFVMLPISWWFVALYVVLPLYFADHTAANGELTGWVILSVTSVCYLFEFSLALFIFRSEGYRLTPSALHERINWYWPKGWKVWGLIVVLVVIGLGMSQLLKPVTMFITSVLPPPDWFPASQHPLKPVRSLEDTLPGVSFSGNYLFLLLVLFSGAMNIIGEDLYYRAALIPKLHGLFGKWAWLAGGFIYSIKHLYVWWRFIADATALGIIGGYIFGPLCSLPAIMLIHFLTNYGLTWPLVIQAVLGAG